LLALVVLAAVVLLTLAVSVVMARTSNRSAAFSGILGGLLAPVILAVILLMTVIVTRVQVPFPSTFHPDRPDAPRDATLDVDVLVLKFDPVMPRLEHCADWRDYPSGQVQQEPVSRETWGGPDYARRYFGWWFAHPARGGTVG
jgi:hypothetical protein